MASERQIAANRANARLSTGPKTAEGKLKSSRNAIKHGLARAGRNDETPHLNQAELGILPVGLAEAQLTLLRIREARTSMIAEILGTPDPNLMKRLKGLVRYERVARAKRRRASSEQTGEGQLRAFDKTNPIKLKEIK